MFCRETFSSSDPNTVTVLIFPDGTDPDCQSHVTSTVRIQQHRSVLLDPHSGCDVALTQNLGGPVFVVLQGAWSSWGATAIMVVLYNIVLCSLCGTQTVTGISCSWRVVPAVVCCVKPSSNKLV